MNKLHIDAVCHFFTDTAALALFDPQRLANRVNADSDWWCFDLLSLDEIQSGAAAVVGLARDGEYRLRVTSDELNPDERDYAAEVVRGLGVEVGSGSLFIGPGECLPRDGTGFCPEDAQRGRLLAVENGQYDVDLYAIDWHKSPCWSTDDRAVPSDAPADFVAVLHLRSAPFPGLASEPRFEGRSGPYLFESSTRQVGPQPGMVLTTKVRRSASNDLCLKDCGPVGYRAALVDYSRVGWKDTIRFKVLTVDHEAKQLVGEFVERVEGNR